MKKLPSFLEAMLGICFWLLVIAFMAVAPGIIDWLDYQFGWFTLIIIVVLIILINK